MPEFRLTDLKEEDSSESEMGGSGKRSSGGFHLSFGVAFVLTFLAIAIAVLVGLIVHFAERDSYDRQVTCTFPETWRELFQQLVKGDSSSLSTHGVSPSITPSSLGTTPPPIASVRLPSNVKPISYDLELTPYLYGSDPSQFHFTGKVKILLECLAATTSIVMNAKDLTIRQSDVKVQAQSDNKQWMITSIALDDDLEMLTIQLDRELKVGDQYSVDIAFSGPLTDDLSGLYLSSYERGNDTVYLATTQFESPDAREAFPCFDEPALKAVFNVTLVRKPPLISLSNTRIKATEPRDNGFVADIYYPTPKMSTYLLAFIVCDFSHVNGTTKNGVEFGIWARSEFASSMEYALETGMSILDYYGTYFGTNFPLKKQDMIAIPDFANGAMENWGLITYREAALLYTPGVTSESYKQYVTDVIAHELAHQWFGNLVTLAWWDDLWLNEGFASYVEYIGMDYIDKNNSWKVWEQFATDVIQSVFLMDQLTTSHPLYVPVATVHEMEQYFDSISYDKGASVIRMIKFCLGEGTFQRGLQRYLRNHAYSNANHTDLWRAWDEQAREEGRQINVAAIMDTWTLQMGFPVIRLTVSANGKLTATQKRFLINPDAKDPGRFQSPFKYRWYVPITITTSKMVNFNVSEKDVLWLTANDDTKELDTNIPTLSSNDWILGNIHQYGYYRVNYDTRNWQALIRQLQINHQVIPPINRAQIIDDAWNLASAGETDTAIALGTLDYLDSETDYIPWKAASLQLVNLQTRLSNTDGYGALMRFITDKVKSPFTKLGFDDSQAEALESYTRVTVASLACGAGIKECVDSALELFSKWKETPNPNPIPPSMSYIVYCMGVREGGESEWKLMLERFRQESNPWQKTQMMGSLACTSKVWLLEVLLQMSLQNDDIKRDEGTAVIGYVAANVNGRPLAWDFVRENWDTIIVNFSQSATRLREMTSNIAEGFYTPYKLQQLKDFISSLASLQTAEQALKQAVETVEVNIRWHVEAYPKIVQWLEGRGYHKFEGSGSSSADKLTLEDILLPSNLRPEHYDITIEPDMEGPDPKKFTFNGTVTMTFTCINVTDKIVLHASMLEVDNIVLKSTEVTNSPQLLPKFVKLELDQEVEFLTILLDAPLHPGSNYSVSMNFKGNLSGGLDGFYLSSYTENNNTVYLGTTQMEPTAARKAFPCMDEPAYKATFSIKIVRPRSLKAVSNMNIKTNQTLASGKVLEEFYPTKRMSTYLVAFLVSDFEKISGVTATHNISFEVWSRKSSSSQLTFALDVGTKVLDYFENYFNIPFPLPKQSMAAIPDFNAGAMENWGLITYRETRLLIEDGMSSATDKENAAITVAHELAHMWFGDLVTPQWWNDIWLNEGFATYLEFFGVDHVFPSWLEFDRFALIAVHRAMDVDGLTTSHPLYVSVATTAEINEVFDDISYRKGASVIRMIDHALGEQTFKKGLQSYLLTHQYGNARHEDLWQALAQQAKNDNKSLDVAAVMDTWTLQMNFPLVTVNVSGQNSITVTQERYLSDPTATDNEKYKSPFGYKWDIPFTYTSSQELNFNLETIPVDWIKSSEVSKVITARTGALLANGTGWVLGNVAQIGYYRVNYDVGNWERLAQQLKTNATKIHRVNRAQLINDAWNLAGAGHVSQEIALKIVEYLDNEEDDVPWSAARKQLVFVDAMLSSTEIYGGFKSFIARKTESLFRKLGMDDTGSDVPTSFLRSTIASFACDSDVSECVSQSLSLFADWKKNSSVNKISPEVRDTVYCTALKKGSVDDWDFLYDRFQTEANVHEKIRLMNQLSCSNQLWILSRLMDRAVLKGEVRAQDAISVLSGVIQNPIGTSLAWQFVRNNWDVIFKRYNNVPFTLTNLVKALAGRFNTRTQLEEVQTFIDTHPNLGTATRAFQAAVETTRNNIRWMDKNYDVVKNWLAASNYLA